MKNEGEGIELAVVRYTKCAPPLDDGDETLRFVCLHNGIAGSARKGIL